MNHLFSGFAVSIELLKTIEPAAQQCVHRYDFQHYVILITQLNKPERFIER
jgi:hypothetical protein